MEILESTPYVIERAKRLAAYFVKKGWFITAGKNNSILINILDANITHFKDEIYAEIILQSDLYVEETGLKTNEIEYVFYNQGKHLGSFTIYDTREFDVWDK
jgi:hypothetical protein